MLDYGICTPQLQLVSTGGFGLLNGGASFSSSSPADPTRKPHLCLLPVLLFCLVLLSVRSAHLSCGALIFPNRLLIPPLSIWQRCRWTMQAGVKENNHTATCLVFSGGSPCYYQHSKANTKTRHPGKVRTKKASRWVMVVRLQLCQLLYRKIQKART